MTQPEKTPLEFFKKINQKSETSPELSPESKKTAELAYYTGLTKLFQERAIAVEHWQTRTNRLRGLSNSDNNFPNKKTTVSDLEDLFYAENKIQGEETKREKLKQDLGELYYVYYNALNFIGPEEEKLKKATIENPQAFSTKPAQIRTMWNAAMQFRSLSDEQRTKMLNIVGYDYEEAVNLIKNIGASTIATAALVGAEELIALGVGGIISIKNPFLGTGSNALGMDVLSEMTVQSMIAARQMQNLRLMKEGKLGFSFNVFSVGFNLLSKKLLPNNPRIGYWATIGASTFDPIRIGQSVTWWPVALTPPTRTFFFVGNCLNIAEFGIEFVALEITDRIVLPTISKLSKFRETRRNKRIHQLDIKEQSPSVNAN